VLQAVEKGDDQRVAKGTCGHAVDGIVQMCRLDGDEDGVDRLRQTWSGSNGSSEVAELVALEPETVLGDCARRVVAGQHQHRAALSRQHRRQESADASWPKDRHAEPIRRHEVEMIFVPR